MIHENLLFLRANAKLTQEEVAEKIGVSRQAVAKWERGDSMPDVLNCAALAKLYDVTLDDLVNFNAADSLLPIPPAGKHMFGILQVDEHGRISIPEKALKIFGIHPGDTLVLLGDESQGLALVKSSFITDVLTETKGNL